MVAMIWRPSASRCSARQAMAFGSALLPEVIFRQAARVVGADAVEFMEVALRQSSARAFNRRASVANIPSSGKPPSNGMAASPRACRARKNASHSAPLGIWKGDTLAPVRKGQPAGAARRVRDASDYRRSKRNPSRRRWPPCERDGDARFFASSSTTHFPCRATMRKSRGKNQNWLAEWAYGLQGSARLRRPEVDGFRPEADGAQCFEKMTRTANEARADS